MSRPRSRSRSPLVTKSILLRERDRSRSRSPAPSAPFGNPVGVDVHTGASPPCAFPAREVGAAFLVYDERCQDHRGGKFDEEHPDRIVGIFEKLKAEVRKYLLRVP
jgi:hypothetical protein